MEHQSLITVVPWTFLAQIANLLVQAYLFKRFLFKPVKKIIEQRRQEIDGLYETAEAAEADAREKQSACDAALAAVQEKADEKLAQAEKTARERGEKIVSDAQAEASALRAKAQDDIALEKKKAVNELKNTLGALAVDIAEKVTEKEIRQEEHEKLIDGFIDRLGED